MRINRRLFCASALGLAACATTGGGLLAGRALGVQMYMLGPQAYNDLDATFAAVAEIGYREIEMNEGAKPAAEVRAALARAGLTCASIHTLGSAQVVANVEEAAARAAEYAQAVGAQYAGPSLFPFVRQRPTHFSNPGEMIAGMARSYTREDWLRVCDVMNTTARALQRGGIKYAYHNHNVEFAPFENGTMIDFVLANTDPALVQLQVDVGWVAAAGVDPVAFIQRHAARVKLLHVKDFKATTQPNFALQMDSTEVGGGVLDWPRILRAGRDVGVEHFLVEQEPPFTRPNLESARMSYDFVRGLA